MKIKNILTIVTILLGFSINAIAQNVYFREMQIKPSVNIQDYTLNVYVSNSMEHSAWFIYKIFIAVDQNTKSVFLSAYQAASRPFKTKFSLNSKYYNIIEPGSYKYYWIDPDRKRNPIDIISEGEAQKYNN